MNDEFDAGLDLGLTQAKKKAKNMPEPKVDTVLTAEAAPAKNKIRIIIDEMAGMKNYEVVGVNGVVYQIKRGVPVDVPPEVVHVLELAKSTHIEQRFNRATGEYDEINHSSSAIPWRRA